ncbi:UNVERIFIED_CONTAM: Crossover junction endonuclease EME1B [Sesamum angustifolium]|uniref:Crossover junction endonuclease EME1B n=1 Tax=Sesamum angustifolium TaxID=2727405 RepID=A0AAW2RN52_9LAMI
MSQPIPVDILSDSDTDSGGNRRWDLRTEAIDLITPPPSLQSKKKQRTEAFRTLVTQRSSSSTMTPRHARKVRLHWVRHRPPLRRSSLRRRSPMPQSSNVREGNVRFPTANGESLATDQFVVADTPMREPLESRVSIAKCNAGNHSREPACSIHTDTEETSHSESSRSAGEGSSSPSFVEDGMSLACEDKASTMDPVVQMPSRQDNNGCRTKEKKKAYETMKPKRISKEERLRLMEEKKQLKRKAAEMKKYKKEMQKWEKGKYALKSIVAEIDKKVVELGSIGGHLLTRFAEKGLTYHITSNPMERTIVWTMVVPEEISVEKEAEGVPFQYNLEKIEVSKEIPMIESSMTMLQIASEPIEISYVLIIYEAEEFCNLVMNESLMDHIQSVQHRYPHHTVCYATNRLMAYINKREQAQYKNPANYSGWKRPAIEEVLARLATHFFKVHSRHCVDEAELAEHVVGLTCSLASCQFRKKLTRLSVNANGSIIPKDCVDKNLIKKNLWLKALVAIPKVQPRYAMAIWKEYPTMKSLLRVYMDPTKSVHEKEFLLKDLTIESLLGDERRLGEVCSKRIYRILMAQCGNIKTDDVENGAGFFTHLST